jgi:hypothetical protein
MNVFNFLLSEIVLLPFFVVLFRWKSIDRSYYPFFGLLIAGVMAEIGSFWVIHHLHHTNAGVINLFELIECFLIIYQFYRWNSFKRGLFWLYTLLAGSLLLWVCSNLIFFHLDDFTFPLFRVLYPFLIVIMSVNEINLMITHSVRHLSRNACFVICLGFIIFFLYQILYEGAFSVSETNKSEVVSGKIISIFDYVNAFVNILYLIAALLIPKRRISAFEKIFDQIGEENERMN